MHDFFTKDLGWKLFSLVLAVVIWLTVHKILHEPTVAADIGVGSKVTYENLPVQIVSTKADVHDFRVAPATVAVEVSGPEEMMANLQANQIRAVVDLTDLQPDGDLHRPVSVSIPPGVTLVSVEPSRVAVIPPPKL